MATKTPRNDQTIRSVSTHPDVDGDSFNYCLGKPTSYYNENRQFIKHVVTSIELVHDIPGLHCNLGRYIVWADEYMIAHIPAVAVECVQYVIPTPTTPAL